MEVGLPPANPLALSQETEDTRRKLYDAAVATHFTPTPEERAKAQADPDHWQPPTYTPDQARLTVLYLYGRCRRPLEETDGEAPPHHRVWTVFRVVQDAAMGGLEYHEV